MDELDEQAVVAYLTEHLKWNVVMVSVIYPSLMVFYSPQCQLDGTEIPEADYHFLKVSVAQGKGTHYRADELLSEYRDYEVLHVITDGKPGGLRPGDSV